MNPTEYSRLAEVFDYDNEEKNFTVSFKVLTKKYGLAFKEYAKAAWEANDDILTEEEFTKLNGDMPTAYFRKVIKSP